MTLQEVGAAGVGKKGPRAVKPIATSAEREAARRAELNRKKRPVPPPKDALLRLSPTATGTKENQFAEGRRVAVLSPGKVRLAKQVADNTGMGRIAAPVAARAPSVITSRGVQVVAVSGPAGDSGEQKCTLGNQIRNAISENVRFRTRCLTLRFPSGIS